MMTTTYLPITSDDFRRLKSALDNNLILEAEQTEEGDDYILVETKSRVYGPTQLDPQVVAHVLHTDDGWVVVGTLGGPCCYEFADIGDVAAFLADGTTTQA